MCACVRCLRGARLWQAYIYMDVEMLSFVGLVFAFKTVDKT